MYEVWICQGQGETLADHFATLEEALSCARKGAENKEGSFAIKYPTGEWHEWNN